MPKGELQPVVWAVPEGDPGEHQETVSRFFRMYVKRRRRTFRNTWWLGVPAIKCPFDLWIYQELLQRVRPDVIVETGTSYGGSAYFLASICDLIGNGRIVTIDIDEPEPADFPTRPAHPRITYRTASSTAPETVDFVRGTIAPGEAVMVILDSSHQAPHVREELRHYSPLVTEGSYLVVEDGHLNAWQDHGPGPLEAVAEFLAENDRFEIDRSLEKFMMTFNPSGYLRCVHG
jgi:cephalosporin hydroxylase